MSALLSMGSGLACLVLIIGALLLSSCSFNPRDNIEPDIYGPPEMMQDYDPSQNVTEDIYGPPDIDPGEWDDPDEFVPDENITPDIYGPPEMMDDYTAQ